VCADLKQAAWLVYLWPELVFPPPAIHKLLLFFQLNAKFLLLTTAIAIVVVVVVSIYCIMDR